jgi:hypothetical protein
LTGCSAPTTGSAELVEPATYAWPPASSAIPKTLVDRRRCRRARARHRQHGVERPRDGGGAAGEALVFELEVDDVPVAEGAPVTLDGTGSSDPDGDALSHAWTQIAGPAVGLAAPAPRARRSSRRRSERAVPR